MSAGNAGLRRRASRLRRRLEDPKTAVALRARALNPYWRYRFHSFGPHSVLHKPLWLSGAHKMSIGERSMLLSPWLFAAPRTWGRPEPALVIGDRVGIRSFCTISATESVVIEDDVAIGSFSSVLDSNHRYDGPFDQKGKNPPIPAPVRIGRGTGIGERVAIVAGARIGKHCLIGSNSVVSVALPDYSIAVGAPARIIGSRRQDFERREE